MSLASGRIARPNLKRSQDDVHFNNAVLPTMVIWNITGNLLAYQSMRLYFHVD